jgi:DNA-binding NarL/FixJ family response regulator
LTGSKSSVYNFTEVRFFEKVNVLDQLQRHEPFIGREEEMRKLVSALEDAEAGHGRIITISGEPGIGKTRCAEELAATAMERGFTVLWGRSHESISTPPCWPWVEALGEYLRQIDEERLVDLIRLHASILALPIPTIREKFGDVLAPPPIVEPEAAQFRLFNTMFDVLRDASSNTPLLILLEDLNWADAQTLQLIEFLAVRIGSTRVLLVGTYRDVELSRKHPLSATLAELARAHEYARIAIKRFTAPQIRAYLDQCLRVPIGYEKKLEVIERTEGNPFFLQETVRQLNEDPKALTVAEGIREVIGRRLDRLSNECAELLTAAAIIGQKFSAEQLELIDNGVDGNGAIELLEEAECVGLVKETENIFGGYRFSHALIQETLIEEIPVTHRVRMHAEVAKTLECRYGDSAEKHAAELLHHFANAQLLLGTEKVVKYAIYAGEQALDAQAHVEAMRCFETGLDALGDDAPMNDAKAALTFGIGHALQSPQARPISDRYASNALLEAFNYYVGTNQNEKAVAVAAIGASKIGLADNYDLIGMCETALELAVEGSIEEAHIRFSYGIYLSLATEEPDRINEQFCRVRDIARAHKDPNLEARALDRGAYELGVQGKPEKAHALIEDARNITDCDDLMVRQRIVATAANSCRVNRDDFEKGRQYYEEAHHLAKITRFHYGRALQLNISLHSNRGKWEEARSIAASEPDLPDHPFLFTDLASIEFETRNPDKGEKHIQKLIELVRTEECDTFWGKLVLALNLPHLVRKGARRDRLELAEQYMNDVRTSMRETHADKSGLYRNSTLGFAMISAVKGDAIITRTRYADVTEPPAGMGAFGLHNTHGYICRIIGDFDASLRYLEQAEELDETAGRDAVLAWTRYDIACTLIEMGDDTALYRAGEKLRNAGRLVRELGMATLENLTDRKTGDLASITGNRDQSTCAVEETFLPAGLSKREVEVLRHLASGKTNQEIARDLFISEKTVHNHLSHVFRKLNVGNRTEATAAAFRLGIEPVATKHDSSPDA